MEPISGIEKLIGFIYRILFTIIPSGAFLCVSLLFLSIVSDSAIDSLKQFFSGINAFWQVLLPLCLIFSLSLFLESIDLLLFYYIMDFGNLSNLRIFGEKRSSALWELKNKDFNELYNKTDVDTSVRRFVQSHHYILGLIKSLINHPRVFSHIYYQLGREFVFNNLTVVVLLISNCFAPYVIANFDPDNFQVRYIIFQILQPMLSTGYFIVSYLFLRKYNTHKVRKYGADKVENKKSGVISAIKKYFSRFYKTPYTFFAILIFLLFTSSALFPFALMWRNSLMLFAAFNCLMLPVVVIMVLKGFKEYLNVERYYLAYFMEVHFLKSDKDFQNKEWSFRRTSDYPDDDFRKYIAPQILRVFQDGMGIEGWSIDKIAAQKNTSTLLGLLEDTDKDIFGYCFVTIPANEFQGKKILWIDSCSISKDLQSRGYYKKALKKVINLFDRNSFGYLGGRTQNPVIMYSRDKFSEGKFLPFDELYPADLMEFLIVNIPEVGNPDAKGELDKETGLCRKVYNGILGKYPLAFSKGRCSQFEEKLKTFGFSRNDGDAIIVLKELN